jgi:hypothetical protein
MLKPENVPSDTIKNVKSLFWQGDGLQDGSHEYIPGLCLEARIDFSDVRTGFRETFGLCKMLELFQGEVEPAGGEPIWNEDRLKEVDPRKIGADAPPGARFRRLPEYVTSQYIAGIEIQFIQYLLRSFKVRIYRNFGLDVYSFSGESSGDFIIRCLELCHEPVCREFDSLHEVFKRKLERLQQKYLEEYTPDLEMPENEMRNRELFNWVSERISALFLRTEFSIQRVARSFGIAPRGQEFEERLVALHYEAQQAVTKILDFYEEKAKSVDEYILHPNMKDIHFVSSYVLWTPLGAL